MRRAMVVYESMYGNTEQVALAIAEGLGKGDVESELFEVGVAPTKLPRGLELLVVGGPTHAFGMSRPATREAAGKDRDAQVISPRIGVREWLEELEVATPAPLGAAFDTHADHPSMLRRLGSAAGPIDRRLRQLGLTVKHLPEHFWVTDAMGPLAEGQLERADAWGQQLASDVVVAVRAREGARR